MVAAVMPVYRRCDIAMVRGEGCYLIDDAGKRYLDFATGIAVNALGHSHPHLVEALREQAGELWHCSNMYRIPQQERLAERLAEATFAETVFFCSSGAEAVEAGIKIMRRYHFMRGERQRYRTIVFDGGFHGRTFGGISAGGTEAAREGYAPLLPGFDRVAWADIDAVKRAVTAETAGILIEPVQGEGGVRAASHEFLRALRALCDERGLTLMCDEVQCGMGRTGTLLAFEQAGITPDICAVAKGIGGGFPLAATLATAEVAKYMTPGTHGSTYGSNPLAMRVGNAVLDVMLEAEFLPQVRRMGAALEARLQEVAKAFPRIISEVRGEGLMLGLVLNVPNGEFAGRLRAKGLLTAPAVNDNVLRILPPLIITQQHIDEAIPILTATAKESA